MSDVRHSARWFRVVTVAVVLGMMATSACGDESGDGATTPPSITLPASTTAATTTSSTTLTTDPPTTTATTVASSPEPPAIHLAGYTTVYSQDGHLRVSGWLDRPAAVAVDGVAVEVYHDQYEGISTFETVLDLEPGEHGIPITARGRNGIENEVLLSVLVDPTLEMQLAMIEEVDMVERTLVADYVEFLIGDEATAAAREDGMIGEGEETPGGFYLRNRNPKLRTLTLGDPGVVTIQACLEQGPCAFEHAVGIDTWVELLGQPDTSEEQAGWHWYGAGFAPYWLTLQDGIIVQVVEQYLP